MKTAGVTEVPSDLVGVPEAAASLRRDACTVRGWIRAGRLRAWRYGEGSPYLVSLSEAMALLRPVVPAAEAPRAGDAEDAAAVARLRARGLRV